MKILCYSDSHGILPDVSNWPKADLFVHAGDVCPNWSYDWSSDGPLQMEWMQREFLPWLDKVPAVKKVIIGGNHDGFNLVPNFLEYLRWSGQDGSETVLNSESNTIYLENSACEIMGKKIWGSPNTTVPSWYKNNRWNYGIYHDRDESKATACWQMIPDDVNILITHSPAYGYFDDCGEKIGSKSLAARIEYLKTKNIQMHVVGHVHEQTGCLLERRFNRTINKLVDPFYRINAAQNMSVVEID